MWLMVLSEEVAVESRRSALTSFVGLMNKRSAPQKVRPNPMKARMDDSYRMDSIREIMPKDSRMYPIIPDGLTCAGIWMQPLLDEGLRYLNPVDVSHRLFFAIFPILEKSLFSTFGCY